MTFDAKFQGVYGDVHDTATNGLLVLNAFIESTLSTAVTGYVNVFDIAAFASAACGDNVGVMSILLMYTATIRLLTLMQHVT